jgi:hypothetical protein
MKFVVLIWVLTFSDLSGEINVYEGSLDECMLTALSFNHMHEGKKYSGCFSLSKQYDFVPRD